MSDSTPRLRAARILTRCLQKNQSLALLLSWEREQNQKALVQALCYGATRHYLQNQALLDQMLERPLSQDLTPLRMLLLCGLYELQDGRRAPHTLVNFFVDAARQLGGEKGSGLCNAILRRYLREREELHAAIPLEACINHPDWLIQRIQAAWPEQAETIFQAGNENPPMHIRVNSARTDRDALCRQIAEAGIEATPLEDSPHAVRLNPPADPAKIPGFREGLFSVQDLSAQHAATLMRLRPGIRVLEACAAPGGKSCHMLELQPDINLSALDNNKHRLPLIHSNLKRLGLNAKVILGDAQKPGSWGAKQFERILLDAPCSATGILRRQPDIRLIRTPENVDMLQKLQARMLKRLWPLLKPSGMLLYCVCSLLPEEGEQIIADFVKSQDAAHPVSFDLPKGVTMKHGVQLLPGITEGDGFYYALLRKSSPKT